MRSIPEADRADGTKDVDLDLEKLPVERALGVHWCVQSDAFQFHLVLKNRPCTRRGILSTVSSIFDLLGIVAPLVLEGKSILQDLCRHNVDWDDPVPDDVRVRWEKWRSELHVLSHFSISRCFKPEGFGPVVKRQTHHFSDASTKGYGQCSYLRLKDVSHNIHCSLVCGKSRVMPLKPVTTPRLELQAAVTAVKISQQLHRELDFNDAQEFFWSDSKVALGYIANDSRRFHIFVANRVHLIQEATSPEQWRYVDTKLNPANVASWGLSTREFLNSRWVCGPEFLWKDESHWPSNVVVKDPAFTHLSPHDPEVKKVTVLATAVMQSEPTLENRLKRLSEWHCAKKAISLSLLFVKRLKNSKNQKQGKEGFKIEVKDIRQAESVIIKSVQGAHFQRELESIKSLSIANSFEDRQLAKQRKACTRSSVLHKLDPFLDAQGILRVGNAQYTSWCYLCQGINQRQSDRGKSQPRSLNLPGAMIPVKIIYK